MHAAGDTSPTSRRWFLAGGVAVLFGGGAGAAAALLSDSAPGLPRLPAPLRAAVDAERALIADLDATTGGTPPIRRVIAQARADHAAHLAALRRLTGAYRATSSATKPARGTPRTLAQLRTAEQQAARNAAAHAAALEGGIAALLASIAACEATHAELLR